LFVCFRGCQVMSDLDDLIDVVANDAISIQDVDSQTLLTFWETHLAHHVDVSEFFQNNNIIGFDNNNNNNTTTDDLNNIPAVAIANIGSNDNILSSEGILQNVDVARRAKKRSRRNNIPAVAIANIGSNDNILSSEGILQNVDVARRAKKRSRRGSKKRALFTIRDSDMEPIKNLVHLICQMGCDDNVNDAAKTELCQIVLNILLFIIKDSRLCSQIEADLCKIVSNIVLGFQKNSQSYHGKFPVPHKKNSCPKPKTCFLESLPEFLDVKLKVDIMLKNAQIIGTLKQIQSLFPKWNRNVTWTAASEFIITYINLIFFFSDKKCIVDSAIINSVLQEKFLINFSKIPGPHKTIK